MAAKIIRQRYYWPTICHDTKEFTRKRDKCQRFANAMHQPPELLSPISSPWPFAQWGVRSDRSTSYGKRIDELPIVAMDYFTKWVEAELLATITNEKVINFVWKNIECQFGIPHALVTDNRK